MRFYISDDARVVLRFCTSVRPRHAPDVVRGQCDPEDREPLLQTDTNRTLGTRTSGHGVPKTGMLSLFRGIYTLLTVFLSAMRDIMDTIDQFMKIASALIPNGYFTLRQWTKCTAISQGVYISLVEFLSFSCSFQKKKLANADPPLKNL